MGKIRTIKTAFVSGELAQQVFGRIDKDFYFKGADKLRNVYVDPLGGVYKREGMKLIDTVYGNGKAKIIPFSFNTEQSYILVLTNQRLRVYKDDILVADITSTVINSITEDKLLDIKYAQSADTCIITQESFPPIKITRTSHIDWVVEFIDFDYTPTHAFNGTIVTEPNATLTFPILLGSNITLTTSVNVFNSSHIKQNIIGKTGGIFSIKEVVDAKTVIGDIVVEFPGDDPTIGDKDSMTLEHTRWQLETGYEDVWSDTKGYPKTCTFYQGRLWFGGSKYRPSTIWGSNTGLFFDFNTGGGKVDDAIDITIDDDRVNAITNIFPGRNLQIFTTGGEFYIPQTETDPIKPDNVMIQKSTLHGSSKVKPVSVDGGTIFIESSGRVVRQFLFNEVERSYNAQSLSLLSSQLIMEPIAMAVRQSRDTSPADYVYIVNSNGTIAVLNILRGEQLLAWSLFETNGTVEDICVSNRDVYIISYRKINGVNKRLLEKLDREHYLDCSIKSNTSTPQTHHTGFNKLSNQEVRVRADSFVLNNNVINNDGSIDIELDYKNVEVGLGFEVLIRMLPVDIDLDGKTLTGDYRRIVYALVKTYKSREFEIRTGRTSVKPSFRSLGENLLNKEVQPYTGWKKIYLSGGVARDATFDIVQSDPVDFDLVSIVIAVTI